MSKPAEKPQDQSMEEILASIRRIISDEGNTPELQAAAPKAAPEPARPAPPPSVAPSRTVAEPATPLREDPDVLELTEVVDTKTPSAFRPVEQPNVMFRGRAPVYSEPPVANAPRPMPSIAPPIIREQLLSQHASHAVSSAFGSLAHSLNSSDSRSIDDLVREMLKPMLKTWLEENLPSLVERLVRAEIERVARGSR